MNLSRTQLARIIDHTLIRPNATKDQVTMLCEEAKNYNFGCVCVNPVYVSLVVGLLRRSNVKVSSTVGFHYGSTLPEVKAFESERILKNGAHEIDMVMNVGALKSKEYEKVKKDIAAVTNLKQPFSGVVVKVIIEAGYLTDEEKIMACQLAKAAGADFVKTSTGIIGGATVEDVRLMRKTVGRKMGVKAAGGIRTLRQVLAMIAAGANRIGTSTAVAIIEETATEIDEK
ncbi:MAG: deoxyribose-phosphate aldolase [Candidatus Bathyarchaeota archaeon]|nr:deoxyribose-phosphate aldolase [Candidatus Bathyarchaeota archaeon]